MLHAAAFHNIQGKVELQDAGEYLAAFARAKDSNFSS